MTQKRRALEIFMRASEVPEAQIKQFLDQECAQDTELRERVGILLSAREQAQNLLPEETSASPVFGSDLVDQQISRDGMLGASIGPYKLLQPLGEGGFGVVYMAVQTEPVRREVALKIIKPGMDSHEVIARFESERQALALMDHPNIARVLDAGQTEDSRPYFVMELVKGVPITDFCDKSNLDTSERLELFVTVCHAVQHAHQKGIIHRDLKPSNVMVALDETPIAKVIDFGVSKAITQRLTEKTLFTQQGQMIGTPQYMSPEQAEMSGLDVDTRSDIYSLGVLLYELLTGTTPLDAERLKAAGYSEMQRIIQEEDPPKPSTRLSTLGDKLTVVCQHRQTDARHLRQTIRGDLDWIVMKALEKRRDRRYATANGLAADIQRHLANETVVARPPSTAYRFQKAWRRNKVAFSAGAAVIVALSIGLVTALWGLAEANHQRGIAQSNFVQARDARRFADEARLSAEMARKLAEAETARANSQAEELRRKLYIYHVNRAATALEKNRNKIMREMLEACPEDLRGWEWHWLNGLTDRSRKTLLGHAAAVQAVAFSPDGTHIVSGSADHTLKLWDAIAAKELRTLPGHTAAVQAVTYSPDGTRIVSGSADHTLKIWDAVTGQELKTLNGHKASVRDVAISQKGTTIASGSEDGTLILWDAAGGNMLNTLTGHTEIVLSVALNRGGNQVASASTDGKFMLWDTINGRLLQTLEGHSFRASGVALSPDGTRIATVAAGELPRLWETESGKELRAFKPLELIGEMPYRVRPPLCAVEFSPDGQRVAAADSATSIGLWDTESGEQLVTLRGHYDWVLSLGFNHDGTRIVSGSADHTLKLWDAAETGQNELTMRHQRDQMRGVAFSPDGRHLASAGFDGTVRVWDTNTGQQVHNLRGHEGWTLAVAYSPDGSLIASGGQDKTLNLWDAGTGRLLRTLRGHTDMVNHVAFSPNGKLIVSAGYGDLTVRIWEVASGKETLTLPGAEGVSNGVYVAPEGNVGRPQGNVEGVSFSPDGKLIAACVHGRGNIVRLWDAETGDEFHTMRTPVGARSVAFSPDGNHVGAGCLDGSSPVWDVASGEEVLMLSGHAQRVTMMVFSPDGRRIFTSSLDGTVKVWHAESGEELLSLQGHRTGLWGLAISPDGRMIAAATSVNIVKLWKTVLSPAAD